MKFVVSDHAAERFIERIAQKPLSKKGARSTLSKLAKKAVRDGKPSHLNERIVFIDDGVAYLFGSNGHQPVLLTVMTEEMMKNRRRRPRDFRPRHRRTE